MLIFPVVLAARSLNPNLQYIFSLWKYSINYLPMRLWFGDFDVTDYLIDADPENSAFALIILLNNRQFVEVKFYFVHERWQQTLVVSDGHK